MSKAPVLPVNAVSITAVDGRYVLTIGSGKAKTMRYDFDDRHFLLMIAEYAKAKGIDLSEYFPKEDAPKAKRWDPWVVGKE